MPFEIFIVFTAITASKINRATLKKSRTFEYLSLSPPHICVVYPIQIISNFNNPQHLFNNPARL